MSVNENQNLAGESSETLRAAQGDGVAVLGSDDPNPAQTEIKSLQNLCDGLQSQLALKETEIEAERSLKWIHFNNAVKFDEEVRALKKQAQLTASNLAQSFMDEIRYYNDGEGCTRQELVDRLLIAVGQRNS